jgi:hypothetical protein
MAMVFLHQSSHRSIRYHRSSTVPPPRREATGESLCPGAIQAPRPSGPFVLYSINGLSYPRPPMGRVYILLVSA